MKNSKTSSPDDKKNIPSSKQDEISSTYNGQGDVHQRICEVCDSIKELLLYKNQKYGNSALSPMHCFYKGDAPNSILIRMDDKLNRIKNNPDPSPRVNDFVDLCGYLLLYLVSMGVTSEDIALYKD